MANIIGQGGLGSVYNVESRNEEHHVAPAVGIVDNVTLGMDENFYFSDTDVDENYIPSEGEVDEEGNENIDGEQYEGLSDEEEDVGLSDVDLEDLGAINDTDSEGEKLFDLNKHIEGKRFHSDNNGKEKYGIEPHPMQLYRAHKKVMEEVEGTHEGSYKKLPEYEGCSYAWRLSKLGLVQAVSEVFPHAWHRCCAKHLFNNFKARYPHIMLRDYFWVAVFAPSEKQFKEAMEKMSKVDNNAARYLMETSIDAWARHAFDPASKSPHVTNNMCESFNQWVNKFRDKPPLVLLDEMRVKLMIRWQKRVQLQHHPKEHHNQKVGMQQKQQGSHQRAQENSQEANQAR
ncbi:hypothetical protein SESBI_22099 [Sesbania bispinosa]|nr:hypothetical protein SESBI_22099 [Sesbania bispinosa]